MNIGILYFNLATCSIFHIWKQNERTVVSPMIKQWKCREAVTGKTEFAARKTLEVKNIREYCRPPAHCWAWKYSPECAFFLIHLQYECSIGCNSVRS